MADKKAKEVDVCLILEGTYPYVRGGVSTWVHQIITSLPELTFSVFYIGWEKEPGARYRYDPLPKNLIEVKEAYLCEYGAGGGKALFSKKFNQALDWLDQLLQQGEAESAEITRLLQSLAGLLMGAHLKQPGEVSVPGRVLRTFMIGDSMAIRLWISFGR